MFFHDIIIYWDAPVHTESRLNDFYASCRVVIGDFHIYRNKTKKTSSFPTPLHPSIPVIFFFFLFIQLDMHSSLLTFCFIHIPLFISLPYFLPLLLMGVTDMNSSQPSSGIPRYLPFPLFQSTCDTLRSHSDSLGFAPNVLPSHPAIGNFEEFACWWRRWGDGWGYDGKLWNIYRIDSKRSVSPRKCTC